ADGERRRRRHPHARRQVDGGHPGWLALRALRAHGRHSRERRAAAGAHDRGLGAHARPRSMTLGQPKELPLGLRLRQQTPRHQQVLTAHLEHQHRKRDRKSTRLNSSHSQISYAVLCWKKKNDPAGARRVESAIVSGWSAVGVGGTWAAPGWSTAQASVIFQGRGPAEEAARDPLLMI